MELFYGHQWQAALELFEQFLQRYPQDGPAALCRDRCRELLGNPPLTDDWNVVHMKEK
jgi:hypothetical protein